MKRYVQFCIIFVISLALPLSGMAGVQASIEPCPMKTMGMTIMDDMGMDCCNDMKTLSEHGEPRTPGQACKAGGIFPVSTFKPSVAVFSPVVLSFFSDSLPAQTPSRVWRPPRV